MGKPLIDPEMQASLREALLEGFAARFQVPGPRGAPRRGGGPPRKKPGPRGGAGAGGRAEAGGPAGAGLAPAAWKGITKEIKQLHHGYTVGGGDFGQQQNPIHGLPAGYQFYFLPRNLYRVRFVLEQLPWAGAGAGGSWPFREGQPEVSILDLGCGSGAFSLAVMCWLARREIPPGASLRLVLVDQGHELLELARANLTAFARRALPGLRLRMEVHADGAERYLAAGAGAGEFTLAGGAMMVNEMGLLQSRRGQGRAVRFATPLRRKVREGGVILLVEPGTRKGYMHLMAARGVLQTQPILYPCPHQGPCPLWDARVTRWCHGTAALPPGFFFDEELRTKGGLPFAMRELNLCGLALQVTAGGERAAPFAPREGSRAVSGAMPARTGNKPAAPGNGKIVLNCTPEGELREIPAEGLGSHPRGRWLGPEPVAPPAGQKERRWKNRR